MKPSTAEIQVKDLNHYGIIAGIIDEIGLVEKILNQLRSPGLAVVPRLDKKYLVPNGQEWVVPLQYLKPTKINARRKQGQGFGSVS